MTRLFDDFFPPEVRVLDTDRSVDFALEGGGHGLTPKQQERLDGLAGFPVAPVFNIRQVHGARIVALTPEMMRQQTIPPEADGIITRMRDTPLAVRTADCLPVFLHDPRRHCIGVVHAGWRGSQQEIVRRAVEGLRETWGCRPEDLRVALGPGIRPCCYQVGEDLRDAFPEETVRRDNGFYLDLARVNANMLLKAGVAKRYIFDCGICTCCREDFFSYRREGAAAGRHLFLMLLSGVPGAAEKE